MMESRDRLLGAAALGVGAAFAVSAIGRGFHLDELLGAGLPAGFTIAECLGIVQMLTLALAAAWAAHALLSRFEPGRDGLRDAAALAGAAYGFGILSVAFGTGVAFSSGLPTSFRVAGVLDGASEAALLGTALIVAAGFSAGVARRGGRNLHLGCAGAAYLVANLLSLVAGFVRAGVYSGQMGDSRLLTGIHLQSAGYGVAAVAGAIAAWAFFEASREGRSADMRERRDLRLAAAAAVFFLFRVFEVSAHLVFASDSSGAGAASSWLFALSSLILAAASLCAATAFTPAQRRPSLHSI